METTNIFQYALVNKIRFQFKGQITTEDLYDLGLASLNQIYKGLMAEKRAQEQDSLAEYTRSNTELDVKIELVKAVYAFKKEIAETAKLAAERKERKQYLLSILARKQDEATQSLSEAEIKKLIEELEG